MLYNISKEQQVRRAQSVAGRCYLIRNSVAGDGAKDVDLGVHYGSSRQLKAVILLPTKESFFDGSLLHELMHTWVFSDVEVIPTDYPGHWGYSSVHGQLGGFEKDTLEHIRKNVYTVDVFSPRGAKNHVGGYGMLELYLAGWIPKEEVPDILVAEDVIWPVKIGDEIVWSADFVKGFEAAKITTWTIDQIVERIGERVPNFTQSQQHFRMATVVIENENFPVCQQRCYTLPKTSRSLYSRNE